MEGLDIVALRYDEFRQAIKIVWPELDIKDDNGFMWLLHELVLSCKWYPPPGYQPCLERLHA